MKLKEEYAKFNSFYYQCLNIVKEMALENPKGPYAQFLNDCVKEEVDLTFSVYKRLVDDFEVIEIESKSYQLLPMGLINENLSRRFLEDGYEDGTGRFSVNELRQSVINRPNFRFLYYPEESKVPEKDTLYRICESYKKHYKENLNESWSEEDFYKMISDLSYLSVKYGRDTETNEIFVVGFFGCYVRSCAGGKALTNAELYVMPEFRHHGIARKMVGLTFEKAKEDGIESFDSITYHVPNHNALAFWESIGASVSGLFHIEGEISEMLEKIDSKKIEKVKMS